MPWFKIDDGFWSHPKVLELSPEALALWVRAGSYCAGHLTDGEVKPSILRLMGASDEHAVELTAAGLWDFDGAVWSFHDWVEYQPTREQVKAERAATRERVSKHRTNRRSNGVTNTVTNDVANGVSTPAPTRPDPTTTSNEVVGVAAKRGTRLPSDWKPSTELAAWAIAKRPDLNVADQVEAFRDYWKSTPGTKGVKLDWDATWRSWIRNAYASKVPDASRPTVSGVVTPVECSRHPYYPAYDCARCAEELAVAS